MENGKRFRTTLSYFKANTAVINLLHFRPSEGGLIYNYSTDKDRNALCLWSLKHYTC